MLTLLTLIVGSIAGWAITKYYYHRSLNDQKDSINMLLEQLRRINNLIVKLPGNLSKESKKFMIENIQRITKDTETSHPVGFNLLKENPDYIPSIYRKCHWCNLGFIVNNQENPTIASCTNNCGAQLKWSGKSWLEMR
ncbi:hypothetical protein ISS37_10940 [candidate division KSB1 bacterium]|nr:hypothetical protein [candidate division KSB1 bacterium]